MGAHRRGSEECGEEARTGHVPLPGALAFGAQTCAGSCAVKSTRRRGAGSSASPGSAAGHAVKTLTEREVVRVQFQVLRRSMLLDGPYIGPEDVSASDSPACVL